VVNHGTQTQHIVKSYKTFISHVKHRLVTAVRNARATQVKGNKNWTYLERLGTASAGLLIGGYILKKQIFTLHCDASSHKNTRLVGLDKERATEDVEFDWKQFGRLLWEDVFSLALAILVYNFS